MSRVRAERRRPVDFVIAAAIVVVLVIAAVVVWAVSPVRHTTSEAATADPPVVEPARAVPERLAVRWRAESSATTMPALTERAVVTADGGEVAGRDPASGRVLWRYARDNTLCAAAAAWPGSADTVLAVYRNARGCSEVTALDGDIGVRRGERTSDADPSLHLTVDSGYVLAQGPTRMETWGSNLVRGIEYGRVDAPVNPGVQPDRKGCRLTSSGVAGDRVAVIEHCGTEVGYRLTVLGAVLNSDEKVTQYGSTIITDRTSDTPPTIVAMSNSAIGVYDGGANASPPGVPALRQFSVDGVATSNNTVTGVAGLPSGTTALTSSGLTAFFTGRTTVVADAQTLRPIYQVPGTLGPGEVMAGRLLLPVPTGISVRDAATGREVRTIPVDRPGRGDAPVELRVLGSQVIEQWGTTVQALGPA